jgi:hypothetical protein
VVVVGVSVQADPGVEPVPFRLHGVVTEVIGQPPAPYHVVPGDPVLGRFALDFELPDLLPDDTQRGRYEDLFNPITIRMGVDPSPFRVGTAPGGALHISLNNDVLVYQGDTLYDSFAVTSAENQVIVDGTTAGVPGPVLGRIGFILEDPTTTALSSDALVAPVLTDFAERTSIIAWGCTAPGSYGCFAPDAVGFFQISAEILSIVEDTPEGAVPAASAWGIAVLALTLLVGAKLYFGRRRALAE